MITVISSTLLTLSQYDNQEAIEAVASNAPYLGLQYNGCVVRKRFPGDLVLIASPPNTLNCLAVRSPYPNMTVADKPGRSDSDSPAASAAATKFGFVPKSMAFACTYLPPRSPLYPANCTVRATGHLAFGAAADVSHSDDATAAAASSSSSSSSSSSRWQFVFTYETIFIPLVDEATGQRVPATWLRQDFPADTPPLAALEFQILSNSANVPFAAVDVDNFAYDLVRKN